MIIQILLAIGLLLNVIHAVVIGMMLAENRNDSGSAWPLWILTLLSACGQIGAFLHLTRGG